MLASLWTLLLALSGILLVATVHAQSERVVDIPTRANVTQRLLLSAPANPRAAIILFAGGHGGLQIFPSGRIRWGAGNFLVRNRGLLARRGLMIATVDAPSDRQSNPYLSGYRQRREHLEDIKAVIAHIKQQANLPVWLIGTSRGTQSAAYIGVQLAGGEGGPDGLVLTASILSDPTGRPVPAMELERLTIPTLVMHHKNDGCALTLYSDVPKLMTKLTATPRSELITIEGGTNDGDPCEAEAYHGFAGKDEETVDHIAKWILR